MYILILSPILSDIRTLVKFLTTLKSEEFFSIAIDCRCGRVQAIEMRISNDYSRAMSTLRYGLVRFEFDESIRKVLSALHPNYKFAFPNKKSIFRSKLQNKFHISINNIHFLWFIFSKRPKKLCKMLK